ncbi:MAG: hypothetical protein IJT27_00330 [Clostridia bacterium]|nr:hypothetical protein [Clostridia bacterium]
MKEKLVLGFYNILSWIVWSAIICGIFFVIFLFFTGAKRQPTFTLYSAALTAVEPDDAVLAEHGYGGENWYRLTLDMNVAGSALSPYSYIVKGFRLIGNDTLRYGYTGFIVTEDEIVYSRADPADYSVSYYVNAPGGRDLLERELKTAGFGVDHIWQQLGFFKSELNADVPHFYLSEFRT